MSQEEKANLRLFCETNDCQVWQAILREEEAHPEEYSSLRQHCSQHCLAYQYNRWISLANKQIISLTKGRYK